MEFPTDAVAREIVQNTVPGIECQVLKNPSDIAPATPRADQFDGRLEHGLGRLEQFKPGGGGLPHWNRDRGIGTPAVQPGATVDLDQFTTTEPPVTRDAVNHFFVDADACRRRECRGVRVVFRGQPDEERLGVPTREDRFDRR